MYVYLRSAKKIYKTRQANMNDWFKHYSLTIRQSYRHPMITNMPESSSGRNYWLLISRREPIRAGKFEILTVKPTVNISLTQAITLTLFLFHLMVKAENVATLSEAIVETITPGTFFSSSSVKCLLSLLHSLPPRHGTVCSVPRHGTVCSVPFDTVTLYKLLNRDLTHLLKPVFYT